MTPELRDYQSDAIINTKKLMVSGINNILINAPTGAGKTVIASSIIQGAVQKGSYILFLAHRRELIMQCAAKLEDFGVLNYSIIMSGAKLFNPNAKVNVASIQTLIKREFPPADLIIIDEAHRAASKSYRDILNNYPQAKVLGLSATPERLDGKGLDDIFSQIVTVSTPPELIAQGFLIKPIIYTGGAVDLSGVKKARGDYAEDQLQEIMDKPKLIGDIVANWKTHADGMLTVAFACGVEHAEHIAQEFMKNGVSAAAIHGGMSVQEREAIIRDWRRGIIKVVANCMILVEGFDFPELQCCILARPTKSISLYLQAVGRIMRTAAGKFSAVILDHAGCINEHGAPHIHREWTLLGELERKKKDKAQALATCQCCDMIYDPEARAWVADVQEKLLPDYTTHTKNILKSKTARAYSSCPGCGMGECKICNEPVKLTLVNDDFGGVGFIKRGCCPSCHVLYDDAAVHIPEEGVNAIPETTADILTLYDSDELPLAVKVKNRFREHMNLAREKGYKRGAVFHKLVQEFGEEAKPLIPRHTADWWRQQA